MANKTTPSSKMIRRMVREEIVHTLAEQPRLYPMGLWDLNSTMYHLKICPLPIVVEEWPDNDFIAHWHDVEAIGFGESQKAAIENLAEDIIALYEDLKETHDKELGKLPLKAKKILLKTIEEKNNSTSSSNAHFLQLTTRKSLMKKFKKVKFRTLQAFSVNHQTTGLHPCCPAAAVGIEAKRLGGSQKLIDAVSKQAGH